jgi:dihydropyrimidinase
MDVAIRGGTIVDESGPFRATLGIKKGRIAAIVGPGCPLEARLNIDASSRLVLPGVIDAHVHMEIPIARTVSADDFTSGSVAGAFGGVTTMIDFAIPDAGQSLTEAIDKRRSVADPKVAIDYGLHCGITSWNLKIMREMRRVIRSGITSFKLFMAYKDRGWMADDGFLFECCKQAAAYDAIVGVHAENPYIIDAFTRLALASGRIGAVSHGASRPNFSESEAVARAIYLASMSDSRIYIFHLSTREACEIVEEWQSQGYPVVAETCPQYLLMTAAVFRKRNGHLFATCPPVRTADDTEHLWDALEAGSLSVVATDHCSFTRKQKAVWRGDFRRIPTGLPGIETLLPLMYTHGVAAGRITLGRLVEVLCSNPARLFGLYPRKGTLKVGSDADIIIIDPEREVRVSARRLHMGSDYSPYEGQRLRGFPDITMLRGRVIQRGGRFLGGAGQGVFLRRC